MTTDKPLVSFILFAYNQEKYVRAAVESALAQTYSPLEIVLSDDVSKDGTAAIMREMAAAYEGPHKVRFVASARNRGIVRHVFDRGREAAGDIVVVAAGDDISRPDRAEKLVEIFGRRPDALAVTSGYDLIDEEGRLLQANCIAPVLGAAARAKSAFIAGLDMGDYVEVQGSTASYRRSLFDTRLPEWDLLFSEDNLLNFLAYLNGGCVFQTPLPLVEYRRHSAAVGNRPPAEDLAIQEREFLASANARRNKMLSYRWIAANNRTARGLDEAAVAEELRAAEIVIGWPEKSAAARLASLAEELARHGGRTAKWQAGRLLGRFPDYQPKRLLARR